jgi:hypothetical protein
VLVGFSDTVSVATFLLLGLLGWQAFIYGSTLAVSQWSWRSEMMVLAPERRITSRTTGERFKAMITDRRAAGSLVGLTALAVFLFYQAVIHSPETEQIYRTNPEQAELIPHSLIQNRPESYIAAKLFLEERAALNADVAGALALWSRSGVIRDDNYTPNDTSDDRVWRGIDQILKRYQEEFRARKYVRLEHRNISTVLEEDQASLVNDLDATLMSNGKVQKVFLSKGDQWILRKENGEWKIASLTFNRTPR